MLKTTDYRLLLLDSRNVQETHHVALKLGTIQKSNHNPLFQEEFFTNPAKQWEARFDNVYPTVLYDKDEAKYKCWYHAFLSDEQSDKTPLDNRPNVPYFVGERDDGVLYATSDDGIYWEKPNLQLVSFRGSKENNIVMSKKSHGVHAGGVIQDLQDLDVNRRYKYFHHNPRMRHMAVAFSPDGLEWTQPIPWPKHNAVGDTHNNAIWSTELDKWVGITRGWTEQSYRGLRTVLRSESSDFVQWSKPIEIMRGQDAHDQLYSMPIMQYRDLYIGLPTTFHKGKINSLNWDTVDTELAWSPDSKRWYRICARTPLIPRGEGTYPYGSYDSGCVYAAKPIVTDANIQIFYGGSNGLHNGWREGSLNLATLELDRFAGFIPLTTKQNGIVKTTSIQANSNDFTINTVINSGGFVRVALASEDGNMLNGYTLDDNIPITSGGISCPVNWKSATLQDLGDATIQILFEITNAKLYAFSGFYRVSK
jgi:hypothetical protein